MGTSDTEYLNLPVFVGFGDGRARVRREGTGCERSPCEGSREEARRGSPSSLRHGTGALPRVRGTPSPIRARLPVLVDAQAAAPAFAAGIPLHRGWVGVGFWKCRFTSSTRLQI